MTPTPVLPSLPEPFVICYEWKDLRNGTRRSFSAASYNGMRCSNSLALFTAEQMDNYARRAIESLSRAPAEPLQLGSVWPIDQCLFETMAEGMAMQLAEYDGQEGDDKHRIVWQGGAVPEPWGEVWQKYIPQAQVLLSAGIAAAQDMRLAAEAFDAATAPTGENAAHPTESAGPSSPMTLAEATREVGKWLNEEPNRPVDRHALAVMSAACQRLVEPAGVTLSALVSKWRHAAEHLGLEGLASLSDCADELETAMAHSAAAQPVEPTDFSADLTKAKNLLVRIWDKHPAARSMIEGATGRWFVWGNDRAAPPAASGDSTPPSEPADVPEVVRKLRDALRRLLDSDPTGSIATATDAELRSAVDDDAADPVVREQAAAVLQGRMALSSVQGDPSGALRPEPEAVGQGRWIAVTERQPKGREVILVAVSWVRHYEYEDGTPAETTGYDVTEGQYVPKHGEGEGYFESFQGSHGDSYGVTHWQPLPEPPQAASGSIHNARSDGAKE